MLRIQKGQDASTKEGNRGTLEGMLDLTGPTADSEHCSGSYGKPLEDFKQVKIICLFLGKIPPGCSVGCETR